MRGYAAALVIACVVAFARSANAAPNVYRLSASRCLSEPAARRGTAFVVKAFRPGQTPVVLVTALHVIHTCGYIGVYDLACQADKEDEQRFRMSVDTNDIIETWPQWDLAVLRVPDKARLRLDHEVSEELDFAQSDFQQLLDQDKAQAEILSYHLPGTSEAEGCMRGTVNHTSVRNASVEYEELAKRETRRTGRPVTATQLLGPLAGKRWLLNYHGEVSGGASGSPVSRDGNKVIAVHEAGFTDRESGWGVVIAGSGLDKAMPENIVMGQPWPPMQWSYLEQSAPDSITEAVAEIKKTAKRVPSQHFVSLRFGLGAHTRDLRGSLDYDLTLGYALHPSVEHTHLGYLKLGFAVDLNGGLDSSRRDYFSPSGDSLESVPKNLGWFHLAGGVDLRLERLHSWFSPSLSAGALLGRWVYDAERSSNSGPTNWDIGLWASAKNRLVLYCAASRGVGCLHLVGAIDATIRHTPTFDYQYTGIGGDALRLDHDRWQGYVGVSLGVELGVDP